MIILVMAMLLPTAMRAWQPVGTATDTLPSTDGSGVAGIGDPTVKANVNLRLCADGLQKVEEVKVTLHMIEVQEQIDELKKGREQA